MIGKIAVVTLFAFGASLSFASAAPVAPSALGVGYATAGSVTLVAKKKTTRKTASRRSTSSAPAGAPSTPTPPAVIQPDPPTGGGGY